MWRLLTKPINSRFNTILRIDGLSIYLYLLLLLCHIDMLKELILL